MVKHWISLSGVQEYFLSRMAIHVHVYCTHFHGQETRDYSASFPFLNWRPPLRLIDQLAIYFLVFLR